jgi:hypothetical protein
MADDQQQLADPAATLVAAIMTTLPPPPQSNPASALSMVNVHTHIPIELELNPLNYSMWRELFLLLVGKFGASNHVNGTPAPNPPDMAWTSVDYTVCSLMYVSLPKEVCSMVFIVGISAQTLWTKIEGLFRDNKVSHALMLEAEFCNLTQGDMSILDYCQCLKSYTDALADVDQPVSDPTLVLTLLRGLNENYHDIASIIKTREPLPTFLVAHSSHHGGDRPQDLQAILGEGAHHVQCFASTVKPTQPSSNSNQGQP